MQENANIVCYSGDVLCGIFTAALLCEEGRLCVCVCVCVCVWACELACETQARHILKGTTHTHAHSPSRCLPLHLTRGEAEAELDAG
jgi:hypothetical protein